MDFKTGIAKIGRKYGDENICINTIKYEKMLFRQSIQLYLYHSISKSFQTTTMAMQRASPQGLTPIMYSDSHSGKLMPMQTLRSDQEPNSRIGKRLVL
jgi:hypothetical protein